MQSFHFGFMLIWAIGILGTIAGAISPWWLFLFIPLAAFHFCMEAA